MVFIKLIGRWIDDELIDFNPKMQFVSFGLSTFNQDHNCRPVLPPKGYSQKGCGTLTRALRKGVKKGKLSRRGIGLKKVDCNLQIIFNSCDVRVYHLKTPKLYGLGSDRSVDSAQLPERLPQRSGFSTSYIACRYPVSRSKNTMPIPPQTYRLTPLRGGLIGEKRKIPCANDFLKAFRYRRQAYYLATAASIMLESPRPL